MRAPRSVCLCILPEVFLSSRVTGAFPVTTDLIMRVNVRTTTTGCTLRKSMWHYVATNHWCRGTVQSVAIKNCTRLGRITSCFTRTRQGVLLFVSNFEQPPGVTRASDSLFLGRLNIFYLLFEWYDMQPSWYACMVRSAAPKTNAWKSFFCFFFILRRMGGGKKNKAQAHTTLPRIFIARRVSISLSCFRNPTLACVQWGRYVPRLVVRTRLRICEPPTPPATSLRLSPWINYFNTNP